VCLVSRKDGTEIGETEKVPHVRGLVADGKSENIQFVSINESISHEGNPEAPITIFSTRITTELRLSQTRLNRKKRKRIWGRGSRQKAQISG